MRIFGNCLSPGNPDPEGRWPFHTSVEVKVTLPWVSTRGNGRKTTRARDGHRFTNDSWLFVVPVRTRVGVLQPFLEQQDAAFDVADRGRFVDGVDVPAGGREREGRDAAAGALDSAGVGAAAREDLKLVGDIVLFGDIAESAGRASDYR